MKIVRSSIGNRYSVNQSKWQYREMGKCVLFKNQLVSISINENCYLVEGDPDLLENWLCGDENLTCYCDNDEQTMEPGIYLVDIQSWVYPGSYEYPEEADVDFSMENIRRLNLDVPQIPYKNIPIDVRTEPPLFKLEGESPKDNYVTDTNKAPFIDKRTSRPRR